MRVAKGGGFNESGAGHQPGECAALEGMGLQENIPGYHGIWEVAATSFEQGINQVSVP